MVSNSFWRYTFLYHYSDLNKSKQAICYFQQSLIRENIYTNLLYIYSDFLFYIHSNTLIFQILYWEVLIAFDHLLLVKLLQEHIILSELVSAFSLPGTDKTQYFFHLSFNSILQLINGISSDLQKLLRYFNGTAIAAFFRIPLSPSY